MRALREVAEAVAIAERLDDEADHLRVGLPDRVLEEVQDREVGLVPDRDETAQSDP